MHFHLLFPLFSSVVFVLGMLLTKMSIVRGVSAWTGTFWANIWLAIGWTAVGFAVNQRLPLQFWWQAVAVGATFVLGQVFTYLAFRFGDVSVATPIFGVKVVMVAAMIAVMAAEPVSQRIWAAAVLATLGVALVQSGAKMRKQNGVVTGSAALTILTAMTAAFCLSLFDVGLQLWGRQHGAMQFLPVMFASTGILSLLLLPWVNSPRRLVALRGLKPMLFGTLLMAVQAMSMSYSLSAYGDAARINIVYALRGLWAVILAWLLARFFEGPEQGLPAGLMLMRLSGALLLTTSVAIALV